MDKIEKLLQGAVDLHVHSGPGLIPRSLDHAEAVKQALAVGMRGLVVKDQHSMTSGSVYFLKEYVFKGAPISFFGGLVLNNTGGGISPYTVDCAIKYGGKIIWMPTLSAKNHIDVHSKGHKTSFPDTKEKPLEEIPLTILDQKGNIIPQVIEILKLIARADVVLATGHLHLNEIKLLIAEAKKQGVKRILMNHPEFIVNASLEEQVNFANQGVVIEHSYALVRSKELTKEYLVEMIRKVGAERTTIGSDMGQAYNPYPVQGLKDCIKDLLDMGVKDEEIDLVLRKNPAKLIGLE
jgi:hypothetical protein